MRSFRALVLDQVDDAQTVSLQELDDDRLPDGDVTIDVEWSSLNYKDAMAAHGHPGIVANPLLVFTTVFGLTVEDLSEGGGPFLGVNELTFHKPVYPGDSLRAESTVLDRRVSDSHKGFGIVTWHTKGFDQRDELAIDFKRTNLVRLRNP